MTALDLVIALAYTAIAAVGAYFLIEIIRSFK